LLDPNDWVCRHDALAWTRRYSVPDNLCFADFGADDRQIGFGQLCPHSLTASNMGTKIIVVSHASSISMDIGDVAYYPHNVAQALREWGLRSVGLLAFKGCELGKATFLEKLASCLSNQNIRCGWLIGYRNKSLQLLPSSHECLGFLDIAIGS
jgi:hypothetical protein